MNANFENLMKKFEEEHKNSNSGLSLKRWILEAKITDPEEQAKFLAVYNLHKEYKFAELYGTNMPTSQRFNDK